MMAAKITAFLITLLLCIAIGIVALATMLIAMNGYSESDAVWGLGAFVLLALIGTALMVLGAFFLAGFLTKKEYGPVAAAIIAILVFSIFGSALLIVSALIGVGVAEIVRVNF
jgi:hypothetical protein